jgi:hypothetical protein
VPPTAEPTTAALYADAAAGAAAGTTDHTNKNWEAGGAGAGAGEAVAVRVLVLLALRVLVLLPLREMVLELEPDEDGPSVGVTEGDSVGVTEGDEKGDSVGVTEGDSVDEMDSLAAAERRWCAGGGCSEAPARGAATQAAWRGAAPASPGLSALHPSGNAWESTGASLHVEALCSVARILVALLLYSAYCSALEGPETGMHAPVGSAIA